MTLATSLTPSRLKLPGVYQFNVEFVIESRRKMIDFSESLNKLFVDVNSWTELRIRVDNPSPDLFIRALPVFADETDFKLPVKRCPNHSRPEDTSNINFPLTEHFIRNGELVVITSSYCMHVSCRFNHVGSAYCEDPITERLSVIVPLGELMKDKQEQPCSSNGFSILVKFMCLNSDVGGPNRRPTQVIFTLEDQCCSVLGRDIVSFKVCCCPKRDKAAEERRYLDPTEGER